MDTQAYKHKHTHTPHTVLSNAYVPQILPIGQVAVWNLKFAKKKKQRERKKIFWRAHPPLPDRQTEQRAYLKMNLHLWLIQIIECFLSNFAPGKIPSK